MQGEVSEQWSSKVIYKFNYTRLPQNLQTKSTASRWKKKDAILAQGCGEPVAERRIVYLATPIDQFHHSDYRKTRRAIASHFPAREWAIFEPARCDWTTRDWLKVWPRLIYWIDALVIWPRVDGSVGFGVYQEACDVRHMGKPIYILHDESLKTFNGFKLYRKPSPTFYARVKAGKALEVGG